MITKEQKQRILEAIASNRTNYPSDAKHAASLGISTSVYSAIKNGQTDKALSETNWVTIARRLGVNLRGGIEWKPARTATFDFITRQLEFCQQSGLSAILCDIPNIGKTFTARYYVQGHRNAIYVDCSQVKTKLKLVRKIATEFGVGNNGRYSDVYEDLVYYLRSIDTPLIILDEAGDLQYEAFLELKALWNATERCCAWYMIGANGLKAKINRSIECKKVGYTEMLSRYGDRYSKVTPDDCKEREKPIRSGKGKGYGRRAKLRAVLFTAERLPGADKETLVEQFTHGWTVHLHQTTAQEYRLMCDEMERVVGYDERREALKKELRQKRSLCLHLMQLLGVDTADWPTVDTFCQNPKVGGKRFAQMNLAELDALHVKLRMIEKHGGLKKAHAEQSEKRKTTYLIVKMNNAGGA